MKRIIRKDFDSLDPTFAVPELTQIFALYLRRYPSIVIRYDKVLLEPHTVELSSIEYEIEQIVDEDGQHLPAKIEIVEWKMPTERRMYFCDWAGFPLDESTPGVQAPGFSFTCYLKCDHFSRLLAENRLEIANLDSITARLLEAARKKIREHFRRRASEQAIGLVAEWQRDHVYPYQGEPVTLVEEVERQVFNIVALNVNSHLPEFAGSDEKTKRLQLRLLRSAIERAPSDLSRILIEVLDLPHEKRKELSGILDRTTLAHVIAASKIVTDRLEFLQGLETLVFQDGIRDLVRERTQLHRIVAENAWMFGEQYHISVDDESLTQVLKKHLAKRGREVEIDRPVLRADGRRGIVDLMFSKNTQVAGSEEREHLVVELKRPDVPIDAEVAAQIESYAFAVADDERFREVPAKWVFWAISSDMDQFVKRKVAQRDRARGILFQDEEQRITIWVKT